MAEAEIINLIPNPKEKFLTLLQLVLQVQACSECQSHLSLLSAKLLLHIR
jgi:hypothetical protein